MSRAVRFTGHRLIRAPVQKVWHLVSRPEIHPRYATMWLAADVLERPQMGPVIEFRGFFGGLPLTSIQRFTLKPPWRLEFRQLRGELRDLSGAYVLKDADGETDLTCEMVVDAGIPLFTDASVEQILAGHVEGTLNRIKASAERDLVRPILRRGRAAATGEIRDADVDEDDESAAPEMPVSAPVDAGSHRDAAGEAPASDHTLIEEDAQGPPDVPAPSDATPATAGQPPGRPGRPPGYRRRRRRRRRGGRAAGPGG